MTFVPMPDSPLRIPAAWIGRDLQDSSDWAYELTARDIDELEAATKAALDSGLGFGDLSPRNFFLPTLGPTLKLLTTQVQEGYGFSLIRGLPVDGSAEVVETMYMGLGSYFGVPMVQDPTGQLMAHVRNEGTAYDNSVRSYRSNIPLSYHSDWSDMVALACIKPAKWGGISRIVSAVTVHNILMEEYPELLRELYSVPVYMDWKNEGPAGQLPYYWVRIFNWFEDKLSTSYANRVIRDTHAQTAELPDLTTLQEEGLKTIEEITSRPELPLDMNFRAGDIQILNNYHIWHSRTPYEDYPEKERQRHLLRIWLAEPAGRQLSISFTNRYEIVGALGQIPRSRVFVAV